MQRAVLVMFLAMSLIPTGDSAGKLLSGTYETAPIFIAWSRFFIGAILIAPFVPSSVWSLLRDWRIWLRASTLTGGISCIQMALQVEEFATVFAAFFIGPLVSYVLAIVFLREPVTWMRSSLVFIGFVGVLIVVNPSGETGPGIIWAIAAGCFYGGFLTMSRWLGALASPIEMTFSQLFISTLYLLPFGLMNLPTFSGTIVLLTGVSALFSMLGNLLLIYAYGLAPATRLAPLVYFQLIAAVGLGWAMFGDLPDVWTWMGLTVILTAGLASARLR